jgi:hypothetical protein
MLQQRARGFALRDSFPDALRGLISHEEAQDIPGPVYEVQEPLTPSTPEPQQITDNSAMLDEIARCEAKQRLREIYNGTKDQVLRDACKARADQLQAEVDAVKREAEAAVQTEAEWMARGAEENGDAATEGLEQMKLAVQADTPRTPAHG